MDFFLQQTANGLALASVLALFALGFSLVLANLKIFHVAHEGVFAWGAVFAWLLMDRLDFPFVLAAIGSIIGAGLLNVLAYLLLIRRLEGRPNAELAGFISSLGGVIVLSEAAEVVLDRSTKRLPFDAFPIHVWEIAGVRVSSIQATMVVSTVAAFIFLHWLVERTEVGREMKTVAYDRELAGLLGINAQRVSALVFFISGGFGGLAAVLVAVAFNVIDSQLGQAYLVIAIAVTVIGGFGSIKGAVVGAVIVGLASTYTTSYWTSSFRDVVVFGMLMLFLMIRPTGLFRVPDAVGRA
jgi:branched-chain amino acid transport system permease protein